MKQKMVFITKPTSIILLLAFLSQPLYSLELYSSPAQSNLTDLEQLMTDLQNDSVTQRILVEDLQKQLETANQSVENLTESLNEISELQKTQSKLLKKQDTTLKVLKWSLVLSIPIAFTAGLMIGWNLKE